MSTTQCLLDSAITKLLTLINFAERVTTLEEKRHLQKARQTVQKLKLLAPSETCLDQSLMQFNAFLDLYIQRHVARDTDWSPKCYENPIEWSIEVRYSSECEDFVRNFKEICHIACPQYDYLFREADSEHE